MKNIKSAISLALLAVAPAIYAQNIDTKSAPDVPTFSVTLNVTNNGGGLDSVFVKKTIKTTEDSLILSGTNSLKLTYNTAPTFRLKANSQYMLESFTVNGTKVTGMNEAFNSLYKGVNSYTYSSSALTEKTDVVITWKAKPELPVTITGTEMIVKENTFPTFSYTLPTDYTKATSDTTYYSDAACTKKLAEDIKGKVGTFYVKFSIAETAGYKAFDKIVSLVVTNKKQLEATGENAPECNVTLIAGQPLSAAAIIGSKVTVAGETSAHSINGTWTWVNPNALVKAGSGDGNKYDAIFTPDSAAVYSSLAATIEVEAKIVDVITVKQTAGGFISIKDAVADNKYIGTTSSHKADIEIAATPDAGYKFVKWVTPASLTAVEPNSSPAGSESKVTAKFTPNGDTEISAEFARATRNVSVSSVAYGTVKVMNGNSEITGSTGVPVVVGANLTIIATPDEGYEVDQVGYTAATNANTNNNNEITPATSFIVGGESATSYTVSATFKQKANPHVVTVSDLKNGSLKLMKNGAEDLNPGSSVEDHASISVIALPNKGYKLDALIVSSLNDGTSKDITETGLVGDVSDDIVIQATFTEADYSVTVTPVEGASFNLSTTTKKFNETLENVTATVDKNNYKLVSLLVNNKPVPNGSDIKIEGPTYISAQVQKLATLSILNPASKEVTYSGQIQEYAVQTAAGLGGFSVTYKLDGKEATPTNVGDYTVNITRPADDIYAAFSATRQLKINPGVPGILTIPFKDVITSSNEGIISNSATVAGHWSDKATRAGGFKASDDLVTVYFIPDDPNLQIVQVTTPKDQQTAAGLVKTITMPTNIAGGRLVLKNGDAAVTDGSTYKGQIFTLEAIPDNGYYVDWSGISGVTLDEYHSFELGDNEVQITASNLFKAKNTITLTGNLSANVTYTGSSVELSSLSGLTPATGWVFTFKANDEFTTPVNVGDYKIWASREEDNSYKAFVSAEVGILIIKQPSISATKDVTLPVATPVLKGASLSTSELNGGSVQVNGQMVAGRFEWEGTEAISVAGEHNVKFTPNDVVNYPALTGLKVYVSLKDAPAYTFTSNTNEVTFTDATGLEVVPGTDKIPAGMKLTITPKSGTISGVSVKGQGAQSGQVTTDAGTTWYCIAGTENFDVTVTFKSGSEGGGDTPAEGTPVTGISLNKSTLTLPRLKSEKLVATVAPTGATKKDVKWTSTAPAIASVEADGTVKALKVGQATIIATTVDGGFTAMCEVTVDFATALEKILSESHVYGQKGQIVIEPAAPVEATIVDLNGKIVYHSSINNTLRMPACSGVYIVRLSASGTTTTTKVLVH